MSIVASLLTLQVGRYLQKFLWLNQGFKVCVCVCVLVRAGVTRSPGQLMLEIVCSWTSVKWKQSTKVKYHFKMSPLAIGVCLLNPQRQPSIKCTSTNDNNTARPFYFSKLGWASDQHPWGQHKGSNSSLKIFLFSFLSYKANIKNVIWILEKIKAEGHQKEEQCSAVGDNTPPHSLLFYRHRLSLFSSLWDGYTAGQTLERLCPESQSYRPNCPRG